MKENKQINKLPNKQTNEERIYERKQAIKQRMHENKGKQINTSNYQ